MKTLVRGSTVSNGSHRHKNIIIGCFVHTSRGCFVAEGDCPNKNVTFWLYSNGSRKNSVQLDPVRVSAKRFPEKYPVVIIIHGYTGHKNYEPNTSIRPVLLENENVYVISVDYNPLVREPCFTQSVMNVPLVSKCLAQLINNMIDRGIVDSKDLHVIGFSLGAQVAGQTANYVKDKLHHITGLDPAKPLFVKVNNTFRLDAGDAHFVDIIHTNTLERGILKPMGHVDFYPNFRVGEQPGCKNVKDPGSCSHNRAPAFYAESITSKTGFFGIRCDNANSFIFGKCKVQNSMAPMGYRALPNLSGTYFLETYARKPFAAGYKGALITPSAADLLAKTSREPVDQLEMKLEVRFLKVQISELQKAMSRAG